MQFTLSWSPFLVCRNRGTDWLSELPDTAELTLVGQYPSPSNCCFRHHAICLLAQGLPSLSSGSAEMQAAQSQNVLRYSLKPGRKAQYLHVPTSPQALYFPFLLFFSPFSRTSRRPFSKLSPLALGPSVQSGRNKMSKKEINIRFAFDYKGLKA